MWRILPHALPFKRAPVNVVPLLRHGTQPRRKQALATARKQMKPKWLQGGAAVAILLILVVVVGLVLAVVTAMFDKKL